MQEVKIGDRVRVKFQNNNINYDETGTVIHIITDSYNGLDYLVEFDKNFIFMHNGNVTQPSLGIGLPNHCWWVEHVKKIENSFTSDKKYILL
jgi:hypothetical protein